MRFSRRAVLSAVVLLGATGAFSTCSTDETSGGEDPPRTVNDTLRVTAANATALAVLSNDENLTNKPLTLTIAEAPTVGTAAFNSDQTVRLDLPAGFHGVTRFKYKVTNSLGGFSVSSAVVFADVPAYRVLFAAQSSAQAYELFATDFNSTVQVSEATSGNLRLQHVWHSKSGSLISYERADSANPTATAELFYVHTTPVGAPAKIPLPRDSSFINSAPVAISGDDRWLAFPTGPATDASVGASLYALDTNGTHDPVLVGLSSNVLTGLTVWGGDEPALYFMSAPDNTGGVAVYRASLDNLDSPERVSPVYANGETHNQIFVSSDQTQLVLLGTHAGQAGAFLINPDNPDLERRLTTDVPVGAVIESFQMNSDFSQLTYLWRLGVEARARLSVVPVATSGVPRSVLDANIASFTDVRPDGATALITRSDNGASSDGTLFEVPLEGSTADLPIAPSVSGGVYDDTGERVYLFSRTLAPAEIERSDFDRDSSPLVRDTTAPLALFVVPLTARSAAIVEDATSGLVLVNAAAPGKTIKLSTLQVGTISPTLFPFAIPPSP